MRLFMLVAVGLWTSALWAQDFYHWQDPQLLARLSYGSSPMPGQSIRKICIAVSQDGSYRMLSWTEINNPSSGNGKMGKEQLQKLKELLTAPAFRSLSGNHAGMIRDRAETFMAEISRIQLPHAVQPKGMTPTTGSPRSQPEAPHWLQWLNGDGENPFPAPMAKVIDWMRAFEPANRQLLRNADMFNVCPSVGFSLVQPLKAENHRP